MAKILLVDDESNLRKVVRLTLSKIGHEVVEASDGFEAVKLFPTLKPDLVITDLVMPGKEGIETIVDLKKMDPQVRILAMSGGGQYGGMAYLTIAKTLGAVGVIAKPFECQDLVSAVSNALVAPLNPPKDV